MKKGWMVAVSGAAVVSATMVLLSCSRGDRPGTLGLSGNIEVTQADVSFRIPGRVAERAVDEGQILKAGQVVARLDSQDLQQQVALRKADLETAQAALAELQAGYRKEEVEAARAQLDQAKAELVRQEAEEKRNQTLLAKEVISPREYDATHAAYESSKARVREADQHYALLEKGPRPEDIAQAQGRVDAARQALSLAETQLGYATLVSPLGGVVLSKNVEPGEVVAAGTPVVSVGDLKDVYLRAYVEETDMGRVKVGQKVSVTTDTYRGKVYEGRVSFISPEAEFTPKSVQTKKERVKLVYRIKVDIPNPAMELKPGMPADAVIQTGS